MDSRTNESIFIPNDQTIRAVMLARYKTLEFLKSNLPNKATCVQLISLIEKAQNQMMTLLCSTKFLEGHDLVEPMCVLLNAASSLAIEWGFLKENDIEKPKFVHISVFAAICRLSAIDAHFIGESEVIHSCTNEKAVSQALKRIRNPSSIGLPNSFFTSENLKKLSTWDIWVNAIHVQNKEKAIAQKKEIINSILLEFQTLYPEFQNFQKKLMNCFDEESKKYQANLNAKTKLTDELNQLSTPKYEYKGRACGHWDYCDCRDADSYPLNVEIPFTPEEIHKMKQLKDEIACCDEEKEQYILHPLLGHDRFLKEMYHMEHCDIVEPNIRKKLQHSILSLCKTLGELIASQTPYNRQAIWRFESAVLDTVTFTKHLFYVLFLIPTNMHELSECITHFGKSDAVFPHLSGILVALCFEKDKDKTFYYSSDIRALSLTFLMKLYQSLDVQGKADNKRWMLNVLRDFFFPALAPTPDKDEDQFLKTIMEHATHPKLLHVVQEFLSANVLCTEEALQNRTHFYHSKIEFLQEADYIWSRASQTLYYVSRKSAVQTNLVTVHLLEKERWVNFISKIEQSSSQFITLNDADLYQHIISNSNNFYALNRLVRCLKDEAPTSANGIFSRSSSTSSAPSSTAQPKGVFKNQ